MMRPKTYVIFQECIETALSVGVARAFKHSEPLSDEQEKYLKEQLYLAIMNEVCERFAFEDGEVRDS